MINRVFVAGVSGGAREVVIHTKSPVSSTRPDQPEPLILKVDAWVRAAPGHGHPPGVVVKVVDPGMGFRLVQVRTHGSRHPYVARDSELVVVPNAQESQPC